MSHPRVAILDYGNFGSVANAVRKLGAEVHAMYPTNVPPHGTTHVILPGQGSFQTVAARHPDDWRHLNQWRDLGRPILGICLGMQLMCESSEEAPGVQGLGWIEATCRRLRAIRLPHIGWNDVGGPRVDYYFCHSYAILPSDPLFDNKNIRWSMEFAEYEGQNFVASLRAGNLWAVQFHPEKSGKAGLALLADFLRL